MMPESTFEYAPFVYGPMPGEFIEDTYDRYIFEGDKRPVLEAWVKDRFEEALKQSDEQTHTFGRLTLTKKIQTSTPTHWKGVYEKLKTFLEIRADDSKANGIEGLMYAQGTGYSASVYMLLGEIEARIKEFTSISEFTKIVGWQMLGKQEAVRAISIPNRNYSKITEENALVCQKVRKYISSLEKEVLKPYKRANEIWHRIQTSYDDEEKVPPEEESPVARSRLIAKGKLISILLSRVETPQYKAILSKLQKELTLQGGEKEFKEIYIPTYLEGVLHVNIKRTKERLEDLTKENTKVTGRYIIEHAHSVRD